LITFIGQLKIVNKLVLEMRDGVSTIPFLN